MKYLGRVAPTLSPFFETSEVKNESSDALLMSQMKSVTESLTKISTSKVDFFMEKFQIPHLVRRSDDAIHGTAAQPPRAIHNIMHIILID